MNNLKVQVFQRPSILNYLSEPFRAIGERIKLISFLKKYKNEKQGDDHPVIVIPGFLGGDRSIKLLTQFLRKNGYQAHTWGLGMNRGNIADIDELMERVEKIYEETGKKISLVGWSLGGVYARQLAKKLPNKIRQVITLCSPFDGMNTSNNAEWLFSLLSGGKKIKDIDPVFLENVPVPASVPTTAFFSKKDGVVAWETCIEKKEDDIHQNIEIKGSHLGVIYNKEVLSIIIDRLKYREENWIKYKAI